jgi:hypothetical protein
MVATETKGRGNESGGALPGSLSLSEAGNKAMIKKTTSGCSVG